MAGEFCRRCGRSRDELGVKAPHECPDDGALPVAEREYCEYCGQQLYYKGEDPCPNPECLRKARKIFGK